MAVASREFQVFVKPIGAICNLDCRYCYYLEKQHLYPGVRSLRMADDVLERYIVRHLEACPIPTVMFSWHGGEPTILGLDYFRRIVALQRRHRVPGREIVNGIQTNGTLLDEEWCRFLAAEGFYVGLSLDGPRELHDAYRITKGGKPTHEQVMRAYRLLQRYQIHSDVLCVVHARNAPHPLAVYHFFKEIDVRHLVFLPLVERAEGGGVTPETAPAEAFGEFLCAIFDEWVREDVGRVYVQFFDEALRPLRDMEHSLCVLRPTCGELPVLEHNGDLYSCDHFVDPAHRLGNIRDMTLAQALDGPAQRAFGEAKRDALPQRCRRCDVLAFCNGGCPKDRLHAGSDPGLNYLCAGLYRFFTHTRPTLRRLAAFMNTGQPLARFGELLRAEAAAAAAPRPAGRNDPCPCGSGRKYKRCCLPARSGGSSN